MVSNYSIIKVGEWAAIPATYEVLGQLLIEMAPPLVLSISQILLTFVQGLNTWLHFIPSAMSLVPTRCLFLMNGYNQHFQEQPLILDDSEFDSPLHDPTMLIFQVFSSNQNQVQEIPLLPYYSIEMEFHWEVERGF